MNLSRRDVEAVVADMDTVRATYMHKPRFGRIPSKPDPRNFPLRAFLQAAAPKVSGGTRMYTPGPVLDQGNTGTCVGHAGKSWLQGAPVQSNTDESPFDIYRWCCAIDEFTDNDAEANNPDNAALQTGTSVHALAKVLLSRKHIAEYRFTIFVDEIRAFMLGNLGTVTLGVDWLQGMMDADKNGVIRARGTMLGGHAVDTVGWSDTKVRGGAVLIQSSWGKSWGQGGFAWLPSADLQRLLDREGECLVCIELPTAA